MKQLLSVLLGLRQAGCDQPGQGQLNLEGSNETAWGCDDCCCHNRSISQRIAAMAGSTAEGGGHGGTVAEWERW